jgi:prophage DNA circulation protein
MSTIVDIPNTVWRDQLLPATFAGQQFHCEANSREGGQRLVVHEFPKRDLPYTEGMGRRAMEFTIRGYCIVYPKDTALPLYRRDYRIARDNLVNKLDGGEPGMLQLPTQAPMWVQCARYRMTEEERFGGYCVLDMSFVEYGKTVNVTPNVTAALLATALSVKDRVQALLEEGL